MSTAHSYVGADIVVSFDPDRCRHFARCVRGLPEVFDTTRRPWILVDGARAERVAQVIRECPSGALHYRLTDGSSEVGDVPTTIVTTSGGPLLVRGDLVLEVDGALQRETRAALCACGRTGSAPFCSGACDQD